MEVKSAQKGKTVLWLSALDTRLAVASQSSKFSRQRLGSNAWGCFRLRPSIPLLVPEPWNVASSSAFLSVCESAKGCFKTTHGIGSTLIGRR